MVLSAVFKVEKKSFWIEKINEICSITEKGKEFVKIDLSREAGVWLKKKISLLIKGEGRRGLFSNLQTDSEDLVLTVKENDRGEFLSISCINRDPVKRPKFVYCPRGRGGAGWRALFKALEETFGHHFRKISLPKVARQEPVQGGDKADLKVDSGACDLERIAELKDKGVILEVVDGLVDWENVTQLRRKKKWIELAVFVHYISAFK